MSEGFESEIGRNRNLKWFTPIKIRFQNFQSSLCFFFLTFQNSITGIFSVLYHLTTSYKSKPFFPQKPIDFQFFAFFVTHPAKIDLNKKCFSKTRNENPHTQEIGVTS